jgi:transposase
MRLDWTSVRKGAGADPVVWFELIVGNASHMKNVPGRKTDVKDAHWIAELIRCGLVRKSFVPPKWQRALRDLTRYRRKLVEAQAL